MYRQEIKSQEGERGARVNQVLRESKTLHEAGFAILWLHEKAKNPVERGWTKGERHSWEELTRTYREGYNVGVRTGSASKVEGGFLACIDVDVKDPKFRDVAHARLAKLLGDNLDICPRVTSGGGNGSMHLYCATKKPFKQITIAKVKDAWEIVVYSDGRQMALPPSIHPSGRKYEWAHGLDFGLPILDFADAVADSAPKQELKDAGAFRLSSIQLDHTDLPDTVKRMILDGDGCTDRSAGLFSAAIAMVRHGLSDDEIKTILTEKDTYLGECAFEHAKTKSRARAAAWLEKYTLNKARAEFDEQKSFSEIVGVDIAEMEKRITPEAAKKQEGELLREDFKSKIERTSNEAGARPKNTLKNVVTILEGEFGPELFSLNEFSGLQLYGRNAPWGALVGEEIKDSHVALIVHWFARKYRFEPSDDRINKAITILAEQNAFHPVREYLDGLTWDGVPRLDTWLKRLLHAEGSEAYIKAISRKVIIAMVARVMRPGCKFDQVLILEGTQGIGKSRAVRALAGSEWFSDAPVDLMNKDGVMSMRAAWIMELGELSGMRRTDVDALKEFVSRQVDRIRLPYGKRMENFPRQCIFIGTTNNPEYLRDTTGNRRFWPVKVGECRVDELAKEREQLLAEARFAFELGEPLWIDDDQALIEAQAEQAGRVETDAWAETLAEFLVRPTEGFHAQKFLLKDLFEFPGPFAGERMDRTNQLRVANCLRQLGYTKRAARSKEGILHKFWFKDTKAEAGGV